MGLLPTTIALEEEIEQIETTVVPTKTYRIDFINKRIMGHVDGQEAMQQAIFKLLQTERYWFDKIYDEYGSELRNLIGKSQYFANSKVRTRITDALMRDDRINGVTNFSTEAEGDKITVTFTAHTVYGDVTVTDFEVEF